MKTLLLLRHAKSSWDEPGLSDHERPLAPRGRRAAPAMAAHMHANGWVPDIVLCSTAVRTRETWALVEPELPPGIPVRFEPDMYGASAGALFRFVQRTPDHVGTLLLVGHNPAMEELALGLASDDHDEAGDGVAVGNADRVADRGAERNEGGSDREAGRALHHLARKFPTAGLAVLRSDAESWSETQPRGFTLVSFVRPRDLGHRHD